MLHWVLNMSLMMVSMKQYTTITLMFKDNDNDNVFWYFHDIVLGITRKAVSQTPPNHGNSKNLVLANKLGKCLKQIYLS